MRRLLAILATGAVVALISSTAQAQPQPSLPAPMLNSVFPPGGKVGTTVDVLATGVDLDMPGQLLFSHPGIKAEFQAPPPPDPSKPPPMPPPAIPAKFKVTIAADVPVGLHDVRLLNDHGVSNPRVFAVSDQNEILETEPNDDVDKAQKIEINSIVSGVVANPVDVDYYQFSGKKGQRIVIRAAAGSIDSRLAPLVEVFGPSGRLAHNRSEVLPADTVTDITLPADGDYLIRLAQFTYTSGGPEHFYRLMVTTAPWIDAAVPPVVEPGKPTQITLYGRNLPGGQPATNVTVDGRTLEKLTVTVTPPADTNKLAYAGWLDSRSTALDGFDYRLKGPAGTSNPVLLTFAKAPVVLETPDNDSPDKAQALPVPVELAGRIEKQGDRDWYALTLKQGQTIAIELLGERIGTFSDFYLELRDDKNNVIAEADDNADTLHPSQFVTRTSDPAVLRYTAPADTTVRLLVSSREAMVQYGPAQAYLLRIGPDQPDFRVAVMPSDDFKPMGVTLRKDGQQYVDVFVSREGGFTGPVTISAEGLPAGVTCQPVVLAPGLKQATLVFDVAANAADALTELVVKGTASINGQAVTRQARPGAITWTIPQPNIAALVRLNQSLPMALRGTAPYKIAAALDKPTLKQGEEGKVTVKLTRTNADVKNPVELRAVVPVLIPGQNNNQPVVNVNKNQPMPIPADKNEAVLPLAIAPTCPPGVYTVVVRGSTQFPFAKDPMAKQKPNITVVQPSNAVVVTVEPTALAKFTLQPPNTNVKIGMTAELVAKVERLYGYAGEYKVKLELPANAAGVSVPEVTIPAGQNEAKLIVTVAADAKPVNLPNLVVKATGFYEGKLPVVHEVKVNLNVVK